MSVFDDARSWIAIVCLVSWGALSIANQIPRARRWVAGSLNGLALLPTYVLFAPAPVDVDYHLVFRDRRADDTFSEWREVPLFFAARARALFNPSGRERAALVQIASALSVLASSVAPRCRAGERIILVSLPYLVLLGVTAAQSDGTEGQVRQFMLVETSGFGPTRRLAMGVSSELHSLEPS